MSISRALKYAAALLAVLVPIVTGISVIWRFSWSVQANAAEIHQAQTDIRRVETCAASAMAELRKEISGYREENRQDMRELREWIRQRR